MREIKFRGQTNKNKWIYGSLLIWGGNEEPSILTTQGSIGKQYEVRSETIGQYVGLKDKNGKERYEGNIFKSKVLLSPDGISSAHNITYWVDVICEIVFDDGMFIGKWFIKNKKIDDYTFSNRSGYKDLEETQEDIGNIHENLEMLEEN